MAQVHDSNFDPLWLYEPEQSKIPYYITTTSSNTFNLYDMYREMRDTRIPYPGGKKLPGEKTKKEKPEMGYNDYDSDRRSDQQKIDDEVRERLAKPRREAEIAKRVALVSALEPLADATVGTVITFTRKGEHKNATTSFAAIKTAEDQWYVTGDGYRTNGEQRNFQGLLEWLTTGPNLVENVQKATKFEAVATPTA